MKTELRDMTFIIPIRVDSMVRLENLILTVDCIQENFNTHIIVLEAATYNNGVIQALLKDIIYKFVEDKDPVFHKTKYLNMMAKTVKTYFIAIWDVDVILEKRQIEDSIQQLREGNYDVAYPYNGNYMDTSSILRNHYWIHRDIEFLKKHKEKMKSLYSVEGVIGAVGGAVFTKTKKYLHSGMDNEAFYGWGLEDGERHYRWLELGYKIYRNKGCLFHLSHPRDLNGMFRSGIHHDKAKHNFNEIVNYGGDELRKKVLEMTYL
jgi:hypothetical protein